MPPFTPPRWLIPWISRAHVWAYEQSDGRVGAWTSGMRHVLLRTRGRRSGQLHDVCLPYWIDDTDCPIIVASFSGSPKHPAWYLNLTDRTKNATVRVRDGRRVYDAAPEILSGAERARVWDALTIDRPFYVSYQQQTTRQIPLVRLRAAERAV